MFQNIFKSTVRNLYKDKLFTILNVTGLSIGMAAFLLIMQFVVWEKSFDTFHKDAEDIYRVDFKYYKNKNELRTHSATTFPKVAPALKAEFPEVELSGRITGRGNGLMEVDGHFFEEKLMYWADPSILDIFSYEMISGDRKSCLNDVGAVVLEEKTAEKYFGEKNPIGKSIKLRSGDGLETFVVTGVIKSPQNSHFKFNLIFSFASYRSIHNNQNIDSNWNRYDFVTYVKLTKGSDPKLLESKFPDFIDKYGRERLYSDHVSFALQPLTSIHLHSDILYELSDNGNNNLVNFLIIIAIFIIGIAWINYINLATATSLKRSKEVGIRKTLGSGSNVLKAQFLFESLLINGISILIGLMLFAILFPYMEVITGRVIENTLLVSTFFWVFLLMVWLSGSLLSGFYPALVLSSTNPLKALKQEGTEKSAKFSVRNILVTTQFIISSVLIAGTIVIVSQINYMTSQELGINVENKVAIQIPNYIGDNDRYWQLLKNFRQDLLKINGVEIASISSEIPGDEVLWTGGCRVIKNGQSSDLSASISKLTMDKNYLSMYENKFVAGRDFEKSTDTLYTIFNESAIRALGFKSPESAINEEVRIAGVDTLKILGVIEDFHQESLAKPIVPTAYIFIDWERQYVSVKLDKKDSRSFLREAENIFQNHFSTTPFIHTEVEENVLSSYQKEDTLLRLVILFSGLAIFIGILGLIGLVIFYIEKKKKEISIRKVLGSTTKNLYGLLTKDIIIQLVIANVIASPIIYYFANQWLDGFAFRLTFPWVSIAVAIVTTLFISLSSVSNLVWKVSRENPIKYLRNE